MCAAIRRDASPPRAGEIRQVAVAILGIAGLRAAFDDDLDRLSLVFIQPAVDDPGGGPSDSPQSPVPSPQSLLVSERLDRIQARRFEGGVHPEKQTDRSGESEADGKGPPGQ